MADGVDLSVLPALSVVEQLTVDEIIADIAEQAALENAAPADPAYRTALAFAYREKMLRQYTDEQAKGLLLAFAKGPQLDHLGPTYYRSASGLDVERKDGESDDDYRNRLALAPEGYSVAGPEGAYRFFSLSADPDVRDCMPVSPEPCEIELYILSFTNGGQASDELCQRVGNYVSAATRRPLGDRVTVKPAEILTYSVTAELHVPRGSDLDAIQTAALNSAASYTLEENVLAGYVTNTGLDKALKVGATRKVIYTDWEDIKASRTQAPYCENVSLTVVEYD